MLRTTRTVLAALACATAAIASACSQPAQAAPDQAVVVASTPIIADLVRGVAGDAVDVTSLVPMGADPHSFEPTLHTLKQVANADAAFYNGLLLERQSLTQTINTTTAPSAPRVALAEEAVAYGAHHIPLVEDASLSTVWLGFRVIDDRPQQNNHPDEADVPSAANAAVTLRLDRVDGPGTLTAFTTGAFGQPTVWLTSADTGRTMDLPADAHTHMSWGFSAPGIYQATVVASDATGKELGSATITFAVGVDANTVPGKVVDRGHVDVTARTGGGVTLRGEFDGKQTSEMNAEDAVIAVPHQAATTVPADPAWRFLGNAGGDTWVLAQAVIGQHVHGDIDPHLWLDVSNAVAYVDTITQRLSDVFPTQAATFRTNAAAYRARLESLDHWARQVTASIPEGARKLVTTHDGFGYLAQAYGLTVTGFVAPNPTLEPSAQSLINLTRTLKDAGVPAVFLEPTTRTHANELAEAARSTNKAVCSLYSDTLTPDVPTFEALIRTDVSELKRCLDPQSLPAWAPDQPIVHVQAPPTHPHQTDPVVDPAWPSPAHS